MDCKENYFKDVKNYKKLSQHGNFIVDMFIDISKKLDNQTREYIGKVIPIDEQKESLLQIDIIIILNYIKQIIIYLIKTKVELDERTCGAQYEQLIQKLEADLRQHIRVEQQLRLYCESLQQKLDDFMIERTQQIDFVKELEQQIKQKNKEIIVYQSELRKAVNKQQQKFSKTITEPFESELQFRKGSQTITIEKSNRNSPVHVRKISVATYPKQPILICHQNQQSYRSTSQDISKYK